MTAPWDVEPCAWTDGPELDRQLAGVDGELAEAERAYYDRANVTRVPPQDPGLEPAIETVHVEGGLL